MRIESFTATPDLIGRRVRLSWTFTPDFGETIADVPRVTVRRKRRDFAYPPPAPGDPYLVYDSATFPPAPIPGSLLVRDLPDRNMIDGPQRIREQTTTVAAIDAGITHEVLRRTLRVVFGPDRTPLREEVELIDVGGIGGSLDPGDNYFYEIDSPILATDANRSPYRATARPGEVYGTHRQLYQMLPEIYRRNDTVARVPDAGTGILPESSAGPTGGGQLRRMLEVFGASMDAIRSSAEGLWSLHDAA
ncbi:MAG TPA: hypothetical protein VFY10_09365, partial [Dehalococcoidia bacterium]|nr:hypothetical protein [Dehalococcoidia bacterium]